MKLEQSIENMDFPQQIKDFRKLYPNHSYLEIVIKILPQEDFDNFLLNMKNILKNKKSLFELKRFFSNKILQYCENEERKKLLLKKVKNLK